MPAVSDITEAETRILEALWENEPLTASQITAALEKETGWHRKTVNTLISRLVSKDAIRSDEQPRGRRYFAAIERRDFTGSVAESVVKRYFGGKVAPLVAHFAEDGGLSDQDVDELRALLEELK